mmetsp:Transcript_1503/g.1602  ORF Transcript_1503/g.1602 Transcript_1503/m.1602 type:complete len:362 (-) Transcript_1503:190-1275(-)
MKVSAKGKKGSAVPTTLIVVASCAFMGAILSSTQFPSTPTIETKVVEKVNTVKCICDNISPAEPEIKKQEEGDKIHLRDVQALDRDLDGITVDITYNLNVPETWYDSFPTTSPSYNDAMISLHGINIWEETTSSEQASLSSFLEFLQLDEPPTMLGSPLMDDILYQLLEKVKPKIFMEVGVFHGITSTAVANYFQTHDGFEDSYVLSMDTWLLDLRFAWSGMKSINADKTKSSSYFNGASPHHGGYSTMYYNFLANCIKTKTTSRIVPVPTAAQNGAMALLSHGIRPDMMYIDASHSNPDVYIDFENFYSILKPGGVIAFDDVKVIPAVRSALDALVAKYGLEAHQFGNQAYVFKTKEKYE